MAVIGDLTVLFICAAIIVVFWSGARRLGRARGGANLMLVGLVLLTCAVAVESLKHVPEGSVVPASIAPLVTAAAYTLYIVGFVIIGASIRRWLPLLRRIDQECEARERAEAELQAALERARGFNAGLEQLARSHIEEGWDRATLMDEAVRRLSQLAGAARVGVWRMDADGEAITCETLFDVRTGGHERGVRIARTDNPAYFEAIEAGRIVNVEAALTDPVTAAFGPGYLIPTGVGALLDAPILAGRKVRGVVCCEHVGGPRRWTPEEVSLFSTAAQYIAVVDLAGNAETLAADLQTALKAAEAASDAKSAFLANMSHELRTPLNGVLGMAQSLAEDGLAPDQAKKAEIIARSGRHLLSVLNDVLDLSRIEAGRMRLSAEPVDPAALIEDVCALFQASADQKGLILSCDTAGLPIRLSADPVRLRQILSNLVANAVKFTDSGAVRVEARARETGDGRWRLGVAVTDTGCGIAPEAQQRLFQRFSQADGSASRRHGGAGLGLVIARELATAMGGGLDLQSTPGEGSCFTVTILADDAAADAAEMAPAESGVLDGARILVVDDNAINRMVARCFVEPLGAHVVEAESGAAALAAFTEARFDLVLLDVHMPGLGGVATLQRLRALPGGDAPVIALTADALSGDAERYTAAGMDGYVAKPVDRDTLINACVTLRAARQDAGSAADERARSA